ncbi:MAG: 23S rRNA (uracil(1939)-C(5))-methyltransferase RlmD [Syntrophobacteraceae bacterium]|nr:23S rRNA (uracil(1939)-C(5))-methyltransferase RlmD [Syntrophobacteraceae bacterium]
MEKIAKGAEIELQVDKLAFGGKALAKVDGFVVFLDRAIPGQTVKALITRKKRNYAEARVIETISQSPAYTPALCPHFGVCGGCFWQDIAYEEQLFWKKAHIIECIEHIAGAGQREVGPVIASPELFHYRNKMEFTFSNRRWLLTEELEREVDPQSLFGLGLHVRGLFDKVLNIDTCFLQSCDGSAILREVRKWALASALPAYSVRTHEGYWRFLVIREAKTTGQILLHLITSGTPAPNGGVELLARHLLSKFSRITTFIHSISDKSSQVAVGDSTRVVFGPGYIEEVLGELRFKISAHSFFQTNTRAALKLYETIARLADFDGSEKVWDLYCGTGSIGLYIASRVKSVIGIELIEEAVRDARQNCLINNIGNCTFFGGDLKDVIGKASQTGRPDVVIVDPPRAGMHPKVVKSLLETLPGRIIAVSCNPASLARDAALLLDAYDMGEVQPVDLFPHTPHLECVVRFDRKQISQ